MKTGDNDGCSNDCEMTKSITPGGSLTGFTILSAAITSFLVFTYDKKLNTCRQDWQENASLL